MSDASSKVISAVFVNGLLHSLLPAIALGFYGLVSNGSIVSSNAFISGLTIIVIASFLFNLGTFSTVQSSVCGKVHNFGHIATLGAISIMFPIVFFAVPWFVPFIFNIIADPLQNFLGEIDPALLMQIVHGYYMFWAGAFASAGLSWFATACPLANPT